MYSTRPCQRFITPPSINKKDYKRDIAVIKKSSSRKYHTDFKIYRKRKAGSEQYKFVKGFSPPCETCIWSTSGDLNSQELNWHLLFFWLLENQFKSIPIIILASLIYAQKYFPYAYAT